MSSNLHVIANVSHVVIYDLDEHLRYDFVVDMNVLDDMSKANKELTWPDWPKEIIKELKIELPKWTYVSLEIPASYGGASRWSNQKPFKKDVKHPISGATYPISTIIINLNDTHKWTREQIADWLDTLDEQPTFELDFKEETANLAEEDGRFPVLATVVKV